MIFGEQLTQEIKCPHGKKTTPTWLDMHILQIRSSLQTNGFQHWIHFIIIISNIWIYFIKNIFKNEMDPVFWVLFFSEALGPIPNWILFRFPREKERVVVIPYVCDIYSIMRRDTTQQVFSLFKNKKFMLYIKMTLQNVSQNFLCFWNMKNHICT